MKSRCDILNQAHCLEVKRMLSLQVSRVLAGIVLFSALGWSQVNTATVSGMVTDPSHAQVPGVRLQLQNEATGASLTTLANNSGQFTFSFVPVGRYTLTVQQSGFQDQVRRGIDLSAGDTL